MISTDVLCIIKYLFVGVSSVTNWVLTEKLIMGLLEMNFFNLSLEATIIERKVQMYINVKYIVLNVSSLLSLSCNIIG